MKNPGQCVCCDQQAEHVIVFGCYQQHLGEALYCPRHLQITIAAYNENNTVVCGDCGLVPGEWETHPCTAAMYLNFIAQHLDMLTPRVEEEEDITSLADAIRELAVMAKITGAATWDQ